MGKNSHILKYMKLKRITRPDDTALKILIPLYIQAFPEDERRNVEQLKHLIQNHAAMHFNAILESGEIAGLFIYWVLGDFYYLEHLAVLPELRNRKIGQQVLDYIRENWKEDSIMEVEIPEDEWAKRRIHYYERNGFRVVERQYVQPAYDARHRDIPLWIMSNSPANDGERLASRLEIIKKKVYIEQRDTEIPVL